MNKSMLVGAVIGGASVLSLGAVASYQALKTPEFAEVVNVAAVDETVQKPVESCKQVRTVHRAPVQDRDRVAGTVIGGLLGGVLGNQVGGGNGKTLATVAGVAGGAYAGNHVQRNMQNADTRSETREHCKTVMKTEQKRVGYDVKYLLNGKIAVVRMAEKPVGDRIPVEHGKLVLSQAVTVPVAPSSQDKSPVLSN